MCHCDPGWKGETCGILNVLPASKASVYAKYPFPHRPIPPYHEGPATGDGLRAIDDPTPNVPISWGATLIDDPGTPGLLHAYVAVCCYNPQSIMHDSGGCQVVHATTRNLSRDGFAYQGVALATERTCPHVALNGDGLYYMPASRFCRGFFSNERTVLNTATD